MSTPRACSVDKSAPSNRPDPSTLSIVARRHFSNGSHMQIAGGVVIPVHTRAPGQDGYRTPTGEDYENHARQYLKNKANRPSNISGSYFAFDGSENDTSNTTAGRRNVRIQSPPASGCGTPRASINRSRLSLSAVGEKLIENLEWKVRIRHFTWTFFTMTMATGGIANVLFAVPFRFSGIDTIGTIFFLFNVVLFLINIVCISLRFWFYPETFKASLLHPTESLFMPAAVVSFGTILINISQYGLHNVGPWLNTAVMVLFWVDVVLAFLASSLTYLLIWSTQTFTIGSMTPVWIFPAYPLLIIGPHAGVLAKSLRPDRAFDIIIGGFTVQGIGYMVSLMIYAAFIYRLMTQKLPAEGLRPGMFVSVGPSGFTCAGIVNMSANAERAFGPEFMGDGHMAGMILKVVGDWMALWLWGLALWFFIISIGAHWSCIERASLDFAMTWYSFVFPNTALITATFAIGKAFSCYQIQVVGCVMTCLLILTWMFVFAMMIRAIVQKKILWPQRQEDRDEGGFKGPAMRRGSIGHTAWEKAQFSKEDSSGSNAV